MFNYNYAEQPHNMQFISVARHADEHEQRHHNTGIEGRKTKQIFFKVLRTPDISVSNTHSYIPAQNSCNCRLHFMHGKVLPNTIPVTIKKYLV